MTKEEKREYNKLIRERRKEKGLCRRCGKEKVEEGKSLCPACRLINQEQSRNYYRNLSPEAKLEFLNSKKLLREERKAAGLCIKCGQPAYKGFVLCKEHHFKRNEYIQRKSRY